MDDNKQNRRLAAIFSADVKDYERRISEDEKATIKTRTYYEEIMAIRIQKHRGRVINFPGNILAAEFTNVSDALRFALEIQQEIRLMNARASKNHRMNFRIGIGFGEVIEEEGKTYGECVNISFKMKDLAEEGGIYISGAVHDQVKNELTFKCDYQGEYTIENVQEPVQAYRIPLEQKTAVKVIGDKKERPKQRKKVAQRINTIVIAAIVVLALWHFYFRESTPPSEEAVPIEGMMSSLSNKLSIAVLPFANLNRKFELAGLSDGITKHIIADLSKIKELGVIPHNRVSVYKSKPVRLKDLIREFGVQYAVEGSVLKVGNKVKIYAHLLDAKGNQLWAEMYERDLEDLAAVQDEIVQTIVTMIEVK